MLIDHLTLEIQKGPLGKHQYEIHLSEVLNNNFIIVCFVITNGDLY